MKTPAEPVEVEIQARLDLGEAYLVRGLIGDAVEMFEEALRRDPEGRASRVAEKGWQLPMGSRLTEYSLRDPGRILE